jgi:hypothetical protein
MKKLLIIALLLIGSIANAQTFIYTNRITIYKKYPNDIKYSNPYWIDHTSIVYLPKDMSYIEWTTTNGEIRFTINGLVNTDNFRFYQAIRDHDGMPFDFTYTDDLVIFYFTEDGIEKRIVLGVQRISR